MKKEHDPQESGTLVCLLACFLSAPNKKGGWEQVKKEKISYQEKNMQKHNLKKESENCRRKKKGNWKFFVKSDNT